MTERREPKKRGRVKPRKFPKYVVAAGYEDKDAYSLKEAKRIASGYGGGADIFRRVGGVYSDTYEPIEG